MISQEEMNAPLTRVELIMICAAIIDAIIVVILLLYWVVPEKVKIVR